RHLADHLRRHRRPPALRAGGDLPAAAHGGAEATRAARRGRADARGDGGGHRDAGGSAEDPGPVREAGGRPASLRRAVDPHPAPDQHRGRDPGHLRVIADPVPSDARPVRADVVDAGGVRRAVAGPLPRHGLYYLLYMGFIIFFTYFYT